MWAATNSSSSTLKPALKRNYSYSNESKVKKSNDGEEKTPRPDKKLDQNKNKGYVYTNLIKLFRK